MQRKYFKIVLLLLAGQLIGELWHFFDGPDVHLISAFVHPPKYLPDITWYVKGIGDELSKILWFWAFYIAANCLNRRLSGVVACFIFYSLCELCLFFWCYKVYGYPYLYCATGFFLFFTLIRKTKFK
jgi:hypothetical protein